MKYVLITLFGGIVDQVKFYDNPYVAVVNLAEYVKDMNPEKNDAMVYGPEGIIANAKIFLNSDDVLICNNYLDKTIYIIANPCHNLGFLVISAMEPVGFEDPLKALIAIEQMRREHGNHVKLYRAEPVDEPLMQRKDIEDHNADLMLNDFNYALIEEYLE